MAKAIEENKLVDARCCIDVIFREDYRPCVATWVDWRNKGYIPCIRIGRRVWYDVEECRVALEERFTKRNNYRGLAGLSHREV